MRAHVPEPRTESQDTASGQAPVTGGPSAYAQAQQSAEVKGLTLHTDQALEQCRELQRHAGELIDVQQRQRVRRRTDRVILLAVITVGLWLAILIVLLDNL
ncbi:MAG TPA: hypothetical protein VF423_03740 [Actinomycetes bacterium]